MRQTYGAPPARGPDGAGSDAGCQTASERYEDAKNSLLGEFAQAVARAHEPATFAYLTEQLWIKPDLLRGVRPEYPEGHPWRVTASLVGTGRIEAIGQSYQPAEGRDGLPALIVPVARTYTPIFFNPVDLVAFEPDKPERLYFREGPGDILGEEAVARAIFCDLPLIVRDGPLHWLQTGAVDAAVLDWTAHLPFIFRDVNRLLVTTEETGDRILTAFRGYGKGPEIRIMRRAS
jgi:hypothetical protein